MHKVITWFAVLLVLAMVGAAAYIVVEPRLHPRTMVRLGDGIFKARIAATDKELDAGLAGADYLVKSDAALFIYDRPAKWVVTTEKASQEIDIVWLDADKKVIHIVKNAPAKNNNESFSPSRDARYILKFPAGTTSKKAITIDTKANFDETKTEQLL